MLFDIRRVDTDARSYVNHSPKEILRAAEKEKKEKYFNCVCGKKSNVQTSVFFCGWLAW